MKKLEDRIQQEIVIWFRNHCIIEKLPYIIYAVMNDEPTKARRIRAWQMGVLAGVSDLIVETGERLIYCEVKTETGTQSKDQKEFESKVKALGRDYILVRSVEDFKEQIKPFLI